MSDEQWQTMIDVNLTGVWCTMKAAVPCPSGSIAITRQCLSKAGVYPNISQSCAEPNVAGTSTSGGPPPVTV
jgi:NADP-dependent 3-hydroxy acid dehydrogenase YdfG